MRQLFHRITVSEIIACSATLLLCIGCSRMPQAKPVAPTLPSQTASTAAGVPALSELKQMAITQPTHIKTQLAYARACEASDPVTSIRTLNLVLKLEPANSEAATMLADVFDNAGYTDRVIEILERRLKLVPNDRVSRYRLARTLRSMNDPKGALLQLEVASAGDLNLEQSLNEWIGYYYVVRESGKAIPLARKWVALAPKDPERLYRQSEIERAADKYTEAESTIRSALKLNASAGKYHRQLSHIISTSPAKAPRASEAELEAAKAIALGDADVDAKYWLAVALDAQKKIPKTIKAFEAVAAIDKTYERTAFRLGRLYQQTGRLDEGKQMLDFMEQMEKNQSRYSQAIITLQNHPEYPENHIAVSRLQSYAGKPGISVTILKRARKRFPNDRHIKDELRQTLLDNGRKAEASLIDERQSD